MNNADSKELHFDVSSGLKSVLGRELITDDEVAIFELVKNSFDADAKEVSLYFDKDQIIIADDGIGMSYDDILNKWLFVAYSSKRDANRPDFRDTIAEKRHYAGSKGVGRFSADRLGEILHLQTLPKNEVSGPVHSITVNWSLFDINHQDKFEKIGISYSSLVSGFQLPNEIPSLKHGTVIKIEKTKKNWDRTSIQKLKKALAKLINPFGTSTDGFKIIVYAPLEIDSDKKETEQKGEALHPNSLVNGAVGNFIFNTLQEKSTYIDIKIESIGNNSYIESSLIDRGELIYKIREANEYDLLSNSNFQCQIYFLNRSAKDTFAKRMGLPSVQFGSVFLFRNGFRVFPIGEEGDDWFKIDRRKQQGYARFLGTRDIIGRVDVSGPEELFQEASSRNTGLIETPAVTQLRKCVIEHCLKRLERYIVPVTFVDAEDKLVSDVSRLLTDPGRARVALAVAKLADNKDIELLDYSKRLIGILDERSAHFESSLVSLRAIAEKTKDKDLFQKIEEAENKFEELKKSEALAKRQADEERKAKENAIIEADEERKAKIVAQSRAESAEKTIHLVKEQLDEEKKQNLFLKSLSTLDSDTILNLHHQVTIYAVDIQQQIENFLVNISGQTSVSPKDVIDAIERVALLNRKIMGISKFATKANFRLESEEIEAVLADYIEQYINDVAAKFLQGPLSVKVKNDGKGFTQKFKPIDVSVVIDNLIANAKKRHTRANQITFRIVHPTKNSIHIFVSDNGRGFDKKIEDVSRIFEKGFSMTDGSGLGLYHVRIVLGEMNGTIEAIRDTQNEGASFLIRISK